MRRIIALIATLLVGGCSSGALSGVKNVDEVVSLRPSWIFTQLREKGVEKAAISFCGGKHNSCRDAKERLVLLTAQRSNLFLGIINGDKYAGVPEDLYDTKDPELMLFWKPWNENYLERFNLMGTVDQDAVAYILCPEESLVFKKALQNFLESN